MLFYFRVKPHELLLYLFGCIITDTKRTFLVIVIKVYKKILQPHCKTILCLRDKKYKI